MNKRNVNRSTQAAMLNTDTDEVPLKVCWQTKNLKAIKRNAVKRQVSIPPRKLLYIRESHKKGIPWWSSLVMILN